MAVAGQAPGSISKSVSWRGSDRCARRADFAKNSGFQPTQKGLLVACPLLSGALLRIVRGLSSDRLGAKPTGLYLLAGELWRISVGLAGRQQVISQLLVIGLLLGVAGASFAVAFPLQAGPILPPIKDWRWALPRRQTAERSWRCSLRRAWRTPSDGTAYLG